MSTALSAEPRKKRPPQQLPVTPHPNLTQPGFATDDANHIVSSSLPTPAKTIPLQKHPSSTKELFVDTMTGMRELAVESVSGFKEWAASPSKSLDSNSSMDDLKRLVLNSPRMCKKQPPPPTDGSVDATETTSAVANTTAPPSSPEKAVRSLYGDVHKYETSLSFQESSPRKKSSQHHSLVHDLMSPFLACSSGFGGGAKSPSPKDTLAKVKNAVLEKVTSSNSKQYDALEHRIDSNGSLLSMDTQLEDEMYQIQRLTSWNTCATENTYGTHVTYETYITEVSSPSTARVDDDGNVIPQVLVAKVAANKKKKKQKQRRKRVVQFDYPPIRSVKECPRVAPEDLDKLFFTEEELDQYEDDRYDTRISDDVEIVAVASPLSDSDGPGPDEPHGKFGKYVSPKLKRKKKTEPPSPVMTSSSSDNSDKSGSSGSNSKKKKNVARKRRSQLESHRDQPPSPIDTRLPPSTRDTAPLTSPKKSPRLLKGVQIYMRQRSTGSLTPRSPS